MADAAEIDEMERREELAQIVGLQILSGETVDEFERRLDILGQWGRSTVGVTPSP
jgi:hypothetical protein